VVVCFGWCVRDWLRLRFVVVAPRFVCECESVVCVCERV